MYLRTDLLDVFCYVEFLKKNNKKVCVLKSLSLQFKTALYAPAFSVLALQVNSPASAFEQVDAKQAFQHSYKAYETANADASTPNSVLQELAFEAYIAGRDYFGSEHLNTANLALNYLLLLKPKERVSEQAHALAALVVRIYQREYDATAIELLEPLLLAFETMPSTKDEQISQYEIAITEVFVAQEAAHPGVVLAVKTAMAKAFLRLNQSRPALWSSLYDAYLERNGADHVLTVTSAFYAAMEDAGEGDVDDAIEKLEQVVAVDALGRAAVSQLQLAANHRLVAFYANQKDEDAVDRSLARIAEMSAELGVESTNEVVYRVNPSYPKEHLRSDEGGHVKLKFDINTSGRTENIRIESESAPEFGREGLKALSKWLYVPAYENGQPVKVKDETVQLDFSIQKSN